ncbi:hypothetical protein NRY95_02255 [Xanthomonas campestris pv. phormiicola]|nr:hypothetical protein [Xanthomonas campestris pv. phormiicola]UYC16828.1 hypothetical protein NRY95_02255 [Xanthomonas campestris pv. phormiicola]
MEILKELFSSKNFTALSVLSALASGCLWHLSTRPVDWMPWDLNALAAIMAIASAILAVLSIIFSGSSEPSTEASTQRLALLIGRVIRAYTQTTPCNSTNVLSELDAISANAKNEETKELAKVIASAVRSSKEIVREEDLDAADQA